MAIVENPLDGTELDEQQQQNANQSQGLQGQEVQKTTGDSGQIGASASPQNQATAPATPTASSRRDPSSSGQFTNLQNYIKANKPANFGQQVAGNITNVAEQAQQKLQQDQTNFNQQVQQQKDSFVDSDKINQSFQSLRDLTGTGQDIREGFDDQKQAVEKGYSQQYEGPSQFENLVSLQRQGRDLETLSKQTSSDPGQRALLQRFYGAPEYNAGQQRLDQLLLSGEQGGALAKASQKAATFNPILNRENQAGVALAGQTKQFADTNREIARNLSEEARTGELSELDSIVEQISKQYNDDIDNYRKNAEYNKELGSYDFSILNSILGGGLGADNQALADRFGKVGNQATIGRDNADPAQAALVNYFSTLTGRDDVVSNIAEATPTASQAKYYLDPQLQDLQRTAVSMNEEYSKLQEAQQAAHDAYYQVKAQTGSVPWYIDDPLNQANSRAAAMEAQLRDLRIRLTGEGGTGKIGTSNIDVGRSRDLLNTAPSEWVAVGSPKTGPIYYENPYTGERTSQLPQGGVLIR